MITNTLLFSHPPVRDNNLYAFGWEIYLILISLSPV
jgi:hypothetical protein